MGAKDSFLGRLLGNADKFSDEQVAQTVTMLVEHGVKRGASDIHIEPHERFVRVRYRIDGALRSIHKLPLAALPAITQQIKNLAHIHPLETHLPQEGQYSTLAGEDQLEVQVFTMPVLGGEKIVLHISRRLGQPLDLEELGFWGQGLVTIQSVLARTHGLLVVAAPRRSGRTTTLHSLVRLVNIPSLSIATIEDSIEYRLPDASQTRVRPQHGVTFFNGLEAALRQDPNVIMVGSLPDKKTSTLAIQAAVNGHLMIAGMHSDNALVALAHLQAAGEEPFLFAQAVRVVISQRLVRKLCAHCRESYTPSREEISEIENAFGIDSAAARQIVHKLEQEAARQGIGGSAGLHTSKSGINKLWRASEDGCGNCHHSGYRNSVAIVEVLDIGNGNLRAALIQPSSPAILRTFALEEGFISMELDGLVKALRGQTALTELLRVFGQDIPKT